KRFVYRFAFGYRVHPTARIGFSIIDAEECEIGEGTTIGHGNILFRMKKFSAADHVRIGHLNVIRGGDEVRLGRYVEIIRLNEINSIVDSDVRNSRDPRLILGDGSVITIDHELDFTYSVE